ncbi:class I SAM-dependent methyltransferase [Streptacidiphilus sp. EB103A]|uniref:class I SAM-dependent methyltransferase n=1 Tax=Streptacidiphilus sp. EB103A TaxID=3156275 RepID=UPI00351324E9
MTDHAGSAPVMDAVAPLMPNTWLRFDAISRLLPDGVTDVLEIGCGQGAVGARLALRYDDYLGIEPDETSYSVASGRVAAVGRGEVKNVMAKELGDRRFDLVCAFEVLEHLEDDRAALAEFAAKVKPGGWLLLSVPAYQSRFGPWDELVGHFRRYDPQGLTELLHDAGFEDVEVLHCGAGLGFVLEGVRNAIGRRRLARSAADTSIEERTAGSGRLFQPSGRLRGAAIRLGTDPFRLLQRAFPDKGTGLVVRARLGDGAGADA